MRTTFPRQRGDQRIFREDFLNIARVLDNYGTIVGTPLINRGLSAGQVRYYGWGQSVAYAGAVSIASHVIVSSTGSNQALWSLGTAASRRMEVGIDATGRPYAWGTAQVLLGTAVSDGHHDIGFSVGADGSVWCVVDGELWGSGSVSFGSTYDRMVVGGSCLGTLPWSGTVTDVHIYRGQMTEAEMAHAMGASVGFQPESLLVGHDGLYMDLDAALAVERNTQPVPNDWDMEAAGTAAYSVVGAGTALSKEADAYAGSQCLRVANAAATTYSAAQTAIVLGNRQLVSVAMRGQVAGSTQTTFGDAGAVYLGFAHYAAWTPKVVEATSLSTVIRFWTNLAGYGEFDALSIKNLSVKKITCRGNLGNLVQATAANMPWSSDPMAPVSKPVNGRRVVYFAASDLFPAEQKADWLHATIGACSYITFAGFDATATNLGTMFGNVETVNERGIDIAFDRVNQRLQLYIANASGAYEILSAPNGSTVRNAPHIIEYHRNGVAVSVLSDGVEVISTNATKFSDITATRVPSLGNTGIAGAAVNAHLGSLAGTLTVNALLTVDEKARLRRRHAAYFGVALP